MTEPSYPIELSAPDIARWREGNAGIEYATTLESRRPGPHVMVNAVTHGNELCGAVALDALLQAGLRPAKGRLTLSFANHMAYRRFDPSNPTASRFVDEDFNRLWSAEVLDGPRDSAELRRAREMRPLVDRVDFLLDIHSMQNRTPPLMMAGPLAKGRALARRVRFPEHVVSDAGHAAGTRLRDYAFFADAADPRNALLIECGQHWARASAEVAIEATLRFLGALGVVDPAFVRARVGDRPPPAQRFIEVTEAVTIAGDSFRFARPFVGLEVLPRAGTLIGHDGERAVVTPYDDCTLIMPTLRLAPGQTAVRLGRYVAAPD